MESVMPELKIKKACNGCPFLRESAPGWLGAAPAKDFVDAALADYVDHPLPCHLTIDYEDKNWMETQYPQSALCAGALIFARNQAKSPRDSERNAMVQAVEPDETVFRYPWEFYEHHGAELPADVAQMKRWVVEGKFP
jgi:hypothetical protein